MTLESVNDSVLCLAYIFDVAPFTFQAINKMVVLACAFSDIIVGCTIIWDWLFSLIGIILYNIDKCWVLYSPCWFLFLVVGF